MSEILSFPGLGLELSINRVAFHFFSRPIYWYGIMFALAFLLGALYVLRRYKRFGVDEDRMIDVLLGGVVGGVIGARLYYVAFTWDTYKDDLSRIFKVWEGGIAMYGSIIGAVIAIWLMCRWRKVKFLPLLDLFAGGLILAQAIGRWGNFFNMEAFGTNTSLPWGMTSDTISGYLAYHQSALAAVGVAVDPSLPVHPTFFYESLWCLLGFLVIAWYTGRRRYDGELTLLYFGWYGLGRFFIEQLRTDSLMAGSLRVSQWVAALCVVASVAVMVLVRRKIKAADDPAYLQLYVDTEEGQAILAGTFYPKKGDKNREESKDKDAVDSEDEESGDETEASGEDADASEESGESDSAADPDADPASESDAQDSPHDGEDAEAPAEAAPAVKDGEEDATPPEDKDEPAAQPEAAEDNADENDGQDKKPDDEA